MTKSTYYEAVQSLVGGILSGPTNGPIAGFYFDNNPIRGVKDGVTLPTEDEIQAKLAELQAAYPLQELREKRNVLLAETDWWASTDLVISVPRKAYRQALRDLPTGLDTEFKVKAAAWPTKPS